MALDHKVVYVVGNARSGTTMMAKLLGRNSEVFSFEEIHFFEQLWDGKLSELATEEAVKLLNKLLAIQREGYLSSYQENQYTGESSKVISKLEKGGEKLTPLDVFDNFLLYETRNADKSIPCEQTPKNALYLKEILENFPNAYVINMIRDPRDILLSQKNRWRLKFLGLNDIPLSETLRNFINYHPFTTSAIWQSSVRSYEYFSEHNRVLNIRFEDLLNAPEVTVREICSFLKIEYNSEMLNVRQIHSSNEVNTSNKIGIDKKKIGRWKSGELNNTEIYICQQRLEKEMVKYEYNVELISPNIFLFILYYVYFPIHLALVLIVNFKRSKNIFSAIKRRLK